MGEKYLLGVDVGTSSIKVAIINEKGKLKGITSGVYNLIQEAPGCRSMRTTCGERVWSASAA